MVTVAIIFWILFFAVVFLLICGLIGKSIVGGLWDWCAKNENKDDNDKDNEE
jgi:hypothetical protein